MNPIDPNRLLESWKKGEDEHVVQPIISNDVKTNMTNSCDSTFASCQLLPSLLIAMVSLNL